MTLTMMTAYAAHPVNARWSVSALKATENDENVVIASSYMFSWDLGTKIQLLALSVHSTCIPLFVILFIFVSMFVLKVIGNIKFIPQVAVSANVKCVL